MTGFTRNPTQPDVDAFIESAGERATPRPHRADEPWNAPGVREDILKPFNLRFPEPYMIKLKYIAKHSPVSMQRFCMDILLPEIDKKIEELRGER